ncbi:hypothetical protein HHK36_022328 [Tetracentron sinense]|uniref:Uncharacterized protein n=1 Tax=Tetracentron sinense TaxID=13715 RepID=A0A834YSQ2_TETSI|nr:hypothetical protein HHK36_022328 [Tetracentron sinense]
MVVLSFANFVAVYTIWVLMTYLTDVWKLSITHAATIVNVYSGLVGIMPVGMAFLLDHCLGTYWMQVLSSVTYSIGLSFLAMSTPPVLSKVTGTCSAYEPACIGNTQSILFYAALALIAVGKSSHSVSTSSFFEENRGNVNHHLGFREYAGWHSLVQLDLTMRQGRPYLKEHVPMALLRRLDLKEHLPMALLLRRDLTVRHRHPYLKEYVPMALLLGRVLNVRHGHPYLKEQVVGVRRLFIWMKCSSEDGVATTIQSYIRDLDLDQEQRKNELSSEDTAVITVPSHLIEEHHNNRLRFVGARGVDETRVTLRIIPIWTTFIVCGIVISVGNTYFLEQASHMNNKLGSLHVPVVFLSCTIPC